MSELKGLLKVYKENRGMIRDFLASSASRKERHLLTELMFCILTSQTKAENCRSSVSRMDVFKDDQKTILSHLRGIRFASRKSEYLFEARTKVKDIRERLGQDPKELREWLIENIKGMGMKLSSHYLRNIGIFGLAILDIHVQRFMKNNFRFIGEVGKLTKKQYLENEKIYLKLSKKMKIPPEELDIAVWMLGNSTGKFYG